MAILYIPLNTLSNQIFSLYSLYYVEGRDEFAGLISASLLSGNTDSFQEMSQLWWAVGNSTESDLTRPRFEP